MSPHPDHPYDECIALGPGAFACVYEVDCRSSTDESSARALAHGLRARILAGRAEQPASFHYVNLIGERPASPGFAVLPKAARDIVMPVASELADSISVMPPRAGDPSGS